jgi:hypothetical protein
MSAMRSEWHIKMMWDTSWKHGLSGRALAWQAWGHEFQPPLPQEKKWKNDVRLKRAGAFPRRRKANGLEVAMESKEDNYLTFWLVLVLEKTTSSFHIRRQQGKQSGGCYIKGTENTYQGAAGQEVQWRCGEVEKTCKAGLNDEKGRVLCGSMWGWRWGFDWWLWEMHGREELVLVSLKRLALKLGLVTKKLHSVNYKLLSNSDPRGGNLCSFVA